MSPTSTAMTRRRALPLAVESGTVIATATADRVVVAEAAEGVVAEAVGEATTDAVVDMVATAAMVVTEEAGTNKLSPLPDNPLRDMN